MEGGREQREVQYKKCPGATSNEHRLLPLPHLKAGNSDMVVEIISETSFSPSLHCGSRSVRLLMEGLFAHFFSPYWWGYDTDDVQWFLELEIQPEGWREERES